jgi:thiosulfate/3-mercaptopyruvate sulfurtransferase
MRRSLVSTQWLAEHLDSPDLAIVDASWHMPASGRNAKAEFLQVHIPGAQFFDIDDLSDTESPLPHMLPAPEKFASRMRKLGIGDGKKVIAYDASGLFSAARAWWMLKVFGHDDVAVLDGGLPKWLSENRPVDEDPPTAPQERHFTARFRSTMVSDKAAIALAMHGNAAQLADARTPARFRGEEPEPRPGVRAGHVPGARNLHYATLLNPDGTMKSVPELEQIFASAEIDPARPVITSCGSGVTAAILSLALEELGAHNHALYDGSWSEWGADPGAPVATGS